MKKVLLSFAAAAAVLLSSNVAQAQVFNLEYLHNSNDTIFATGSPSEIKTIVRLNLEPGVDSFNYSWKMNNFEKPSDWAFNGLCDNIRCHPYMISGSISPKFKAPFEASDTSFNVYNNSIDPSFNLDIPYLWFDIPMSASLGIGYFKYTISTLEVFPATAAPTAPQVTEVIHVIKKAIGTSVERIVINNDDIKVYPNPSNQLINIATSKDYQLKTVNIMDVTGRTVLTASGQQKSIDINNLNSGAYVVEFINEDGISLTTRKFVKQ